MRKYGVTTTSTHGRSTVLAVLAVSPNASPESSYHDTSAFGQFASEDCKQHADVFAWAFQPKQPASHHVVTTTSVLRHQHSRRHQQPILAPIAKPQGQGVSPLQSSLCLCCDILELQLHSLRSQSISIPTLANYWLRVFLLSLLRSRRSITLLSSIRGLKVNWEYITVESSLSALSPVVGLSVDMANHFLIEFMKVAQLSDTC
jgi:hypothetical protein